MFTFEEAVHYLVEVLNREKAPVILLFGDIGAGKTTLVREVLTRMGVPGVFSPTFVILNVYEGENNRRFAHFDFYRLRDQLEEDKQLVLEEVAFWDHVGKIPVFIEWPNDFVDILERFKPYKVYIRVDKDAKRTYRIAR